MHLDPFELHRPSTVDEAVALAGELAGSFDFLAGGTDLLPNYKMHLNLRPHLIGLDRVAELRRLESGWIGGMVTLAEVERDTLLARSARAVVEAAGLVATPLVRESATVGGNLLVETRCFFFNQSLFWRDSLGYCLKADGDKCHVVPQKERCYATFSGDLAPALMVHDAEVELAGPAGRRRMPLADLYDAQGDGIRRHRLGAGELLVGVRLPREEPRVRSTYLKLRARPSFDFPELGVAAALRMDGDRVLRLRLAIGGIETYPRRFDAWTSPLEGGPLDDGVVRGFAERVRGGVRPVHNTFLAPDYRRRMVGVFVRRALEALRGEEAAAT